MLLDYFKQYIRVRGLSERTVGHYVNGINSINSLLAKYDYPIKNVFFASTVTELDAIREFLYANAEFVAKDKTGHNMYSASFRHFYKFVCDDMAFFNKNIEKMDIVTARPEIITTTHTGYRRNQIIIDQALEGSNYQCEHNNSHSTFIAKTTGRSYMEGHHLIPMRLQSEFGCSLDVYANIICLCPICHRRIHYGTDKDRTYLADELFEKRAARLANSGLDLSRADFLELVV